MKTQDKQTTNLTLWLPRDLLAEIDLAWRVDMEVKSRIDWIRAACAEKLARAKRRQPAT